MSSFRLQLSIGAMAAVSALLTSCNWVPGTDSNKIEAAKSAVAAKLKDPTSPLFTELQTTADEVCGMVNGRNSFGAYSGPSRFVWRDGSEVLIEGINDGNSGIAAMNACELDHLYAACQAGSDLLGESIRVAGKCDQAGKQAIEADFNLPKGTLDRNGDARSGN